MSLAESKTVQYNAAMGYSLRPVRVHLWLIGSILGSRDQELFEAHKKRLRKDLEEIDDLLEDFDGDEIDAAFIDNLRELHAQTPETADPEMDSFEAKLREITKRQKAGEDVVADLDRFVEDAAAFINASIPEAQDEVPIEAGGPIPSSEEILFGMVHGRPVDTRVGFAYDLIIRAFAQKLGSKIPSPLWDDLRHGSEWFGQLDAELKRHGIAPQVFSVNAHLVQRGNPWFKTSSGDFPFVGYMTNQEIEAALVQLSPLSLKDQGPEHPETYLIDLRKWLRSCAKEEQDLICFYG